MQNKSHAALITELVASNTELKLSQTRLHKAQQVAHLGSWEMDFTSKVVYFSDEACRVIGLDPQEKNKFSLDECLALIHADDVDFVKKMVLDTYNCKSDVSFDHRIVRKDGSVRHIHSESKFDCDATGIVIGLHGVAQDITERKSAEEEIKTLNKNLEKRVEERTEELTRANIALEAFSYSVSHDLRSPVRSVMGFAKIINKDYGHALQPSLRELFAHIENSSKRMNSIIDSLLELAKYGKDKLKMEETDLTLLFQNAWDNFLFTDPHHATLILPKIPIVYADSSMIYQVIVNLLSNAIKYSAKRKTPQVVVGYEATAQSITIYVADNGAGFDMIHYDRLFGAFQRLHGMSDFEGTGVGLLLVKRIIERHGGAIWAEAHVNEGATFYFSLPR